MEHPVFVPPSPVRFSVTPDHAMGTSATGVVPVLVYRNLLVRTPSVAELARRGGLAGILSPRKGVQKRCIPCPDNLLMCTTT